MKAKCNCLSLVLNSRRTNFRNFMATKLFETFLFLQYQQEPAQLACERWLELNLVPQLAYTIYIKDLPVETLDKVNLVISDLCFYKA